MSDLRVFDDKSKLSEAVAKQSVEILSTSIELYDSAVWVLAGGSTPLLAYKIIANNHVDSLDWTKVTLVMGDERIGPLNSPNNNWHVVDTILSHLPAKRLRPKSEQSPKKAADDYAQQISGLAKLENGLPRFDLTWLGIGNDGHTLSIFPHHDSLQPSNKLVVPVYAAPKPPAERISLTLRALQGVANAIIIATGTDKKKAVARARNNGHAPIALAIKIIETHGGNVSWFLDHPATTD